MDKLKETMGSGKEQGQQGGQEGGQEGGKEGGQEGGQSAMQSAKDTASKVFGGGGKCHTVPTVRNAYADGQL